MTVLATINHVMDTALSQVRPVTVMVPSNKNDRQDGNGLYPGDPDEPRVAGIS